MKGFSEHMFWECAYPLLVRTTYDSFGRHMTRTGDIWLLCDLWDAYYMTELKKQNNNITLTSHERHGVSNHQQFDCFLWLSQKIPELHILVLYGVEPTVKRVSMSWRHCEGRQDVRAPSTCSINSRYILHDIEHNTKGRVPHYWPFVRVIHR